MASLTIKDIPGPLLARLRGNAATHRRSLNREVIDCLERASASHTIDPEAFLARADELRSRLSLTPATERALKRLRSAGRP